MMLKGVLTMSKPHKILETLFKKAKKKDEFEFACTLLRIRGMEDPGWDPFVESYKLANQLVDLVNAPIDKTLRLRLMMFFYCHLTETDDIYKVVANLLRVTMGDRYSLVPFKDVPKPVGKIAHGSSFNKTIIQLMTLANDAGIEKVGELFQKFFLRPVRNAFFHSDYILTDDSFNIRWGEGIKIDDVVTNEIELKWLIPRIELGINASLNIIELIIRNIKSYRSDKIIKGRFASDGSVIDIQLTTEKGYGLTGFKSPPDEKLLKKVQKT